MEKNNGELNAIKEIGQESSQGIVIFDFETQRISYSNAKAQQLIGLTAGSGVTEIEQAAKRIVDDDRTTLFSKLNQLLAQKTLTIDFHLQTEKDSPAYMCCSAYRILHNRHLVVFIDDLSRVKRHENYLLEFGMRKNTMLDTIVHQTSNAILLMRNLSDEAAKLVTASNTEDIKTILALLRENSDYNIRIISDLLREEHRRSPDVAVKTARFDFIEKVKILFKEFQAAYKERLFTLHVSSPSIFISSDEVKAFQIINIFSANAVKFSPPDSEVSWHVSETDSDVVIAVTDRGIGIPDALKPFIFDKRTSAGRPGLQGEPSIGFGLSISKDLAHLLNGKVWFESKEQIGTTFYLQLPKD
jgi:two-component system sensor histidine kinase VicK